MRAIAPSYRGIRSIALVGGAVLALLATQTPDALRAQTVLGTAGLYQDAAFGRPAPTGAAPLPSHPSGDDARLASPMLRHLPLSAAGWRIDGEIGALTWQIYLSSPEAASTRLFRLGYESAASVLPEVSLLALRINGVEIGRTGIAAPGDLAPIEFAIPPNVLRHGFNEVRIAVDQRHRVDCSTEATYELWTQINPAATGFVVVGDLALSRPSDLAAVYPRIDGSLVVRVLFDGRMRPQRIDQIILAAQAIALAGRFERPLISFAADPDAGFGINLIVGTAAEVSGALVAFGQRSDISGPTVVLTRSRPGAAPTLIATGRNDEEVAAAVAQLSAPAEPGGPVGTATSTWPTQRNALRIAGGEQIHLDDLGLSNLEFSGRVFRLPIEIAMPADFLVADYGKLSINLHGAYAAGLLSGAQLQVNLNGRDAASVPLSNASGGLFRHNDIVVPLGGMRPGRNILEITAKLPHGSDQICDNGVALNEASERFLLLGDSEIRFPRIARVGQMPDLAQTMAGGYPYSIPGSRPKLYVPSPDRETLSAAITLAVRLAVVAGHPIAFSLVAANPGADSGHGLVVAPARALDPALMTDIGLDPKAVQRGWQERATPAAQSADASTSDNPGPVKAGGHAGRRHMVMAALHGRSRVEPFAVEMDTPDPNGRAAPSKAWSDMLSHKPVVDQALDLARSAAARSAATLNAAVAAVRVQLGAHRASADLEIGRSVSLIMAQGYRATDRDDVVTIVTAPDPGSLARSVEAMVSPARWTGWRGRLAVMNEAAEILDTTDARQIRLIETQPISLLNLRLVAAGWLSLHPSIYVIGALLMAALLALTANALVKNVGRRNAT
ncbi:MAG: cellulose biosynthesis cyclic di-GMP-binding regulatory protein BcsB [Rhodopseudomonas sp.]|uniref:cellulose biosynthesis cyclic di-GMP-binding regulatory protein BcsB n=1 Tax=Rhodopseudomonas sp. TaxID=1078 RepID=UPI00181B7BA6|nr:cellulose biosynthesis cyclic di-GMP-binding regulatory protein BcsB [Rhodopseudomonas sp.]NVN86936.1 cellulose biosynthesis cyclic di-GMP-binding regulatory protein BcsB [Rhodopseudomonas sp.]